MYQLTSNKQYDGLVTQEKYTPKKPHDVSKFLNMQTLKEGSPRNKKAEKSKIKEDWENDPILNAKYIQ
jgi:hypothetical protein